jgi:hypothetical protein
MSYKVRVLPKLSLFGEEWLYAERGFRRSLCDLDRGNTVKELYYLMKGYKIMKRNIFSVLLVCLMIVSVCVLSGCKVDDLEAQVNENASAAEGAVSDAINKAEDAVDAAAKQAAANLAAAKEELTKLIADGANADADALEAAVADFNAAIAEIEAVMQSAKTAGAESAKSKSAESERVTSGGASKA